MTYAERTMNRQRARVIAKGYEDAMREALGRGDHKTACMWRDCADVAWLAAETGEPLY